MARCFASSFKVTSARGSRHKLDLLLDPRTDDWDQGTCTPLVRRLYRRAVRIPRKSKFPSLQLSIELVEHDVTEQGRQRAALWRPLVHRTHQSPFHNTSLQKRPNQLEQPL